MRDHDKSNKQGAGALKMMFFGHIFDYQCVLSPYNHQRRRYSNIRHGQKKQALIMMDSIFILSHFAKERNRARRQHDQGFWSLQTPSPNQPPVTT